ncbi:MAG: alpha/beta hydrolase [Candidatus Manganitrophaceae bacterium]
MTDLKIKRGTIDLNGMNLFYRETGSDLPPLLCLHGKYGRGETWIDLMRRYGDRFRIIAPDQRGHGLSGKPVARYAGEEFATDAYELLSGLRALPATVVGHSIGGRNAAYLAALYPHAVRRLVLLDAKSEGPAALSSLPPDRVSPVDPLTADWPTPYASYQEALDDLGRRFAYPSNLRYFVESLTETVAGYDFLFSRHAMSAIDVYYQGWDSLLSRIECPVLLVRAKKSWYLSEAEAAKMRRLIKNGIYFEVSDSDHIVYADNPDEFDPGFERFISASP